MIPRLQRRLDRLIERRNLLELLHRDNEQRYTYHGGFGLGYLKGQIRELEDIIDDLTPESD